jgi:hypothetical protein
MNDLLDLLQYAQGRRAQNLDFTRAEAMTALGWASAARFFDARRHADHWLADRKLGHAIIHEVCAGPVHVYYLATNDEISGWLDERKASLRTQTGHVRAATRTAIQSTTGRTKAKLRADRKALTRALRAF